MTFVVLLALAASVQCNRVDSDKITGHDLAAASPAFAALAPDTFVAYTPAPGRSRTFRPEELKRFTDVPVEQPLCFEWAVESLEPERVQTAMAKTLATEGAEIEVLEVSHDPVPVGDLIFSISGLPVSPIAGGPVVWRGQVRYGGSRRSDIWARAKVVVPWTRVVAVSDIKTGEVVTPAQVRLESGKGMPSNQQFATRVDEVVGRVARRSFPGGAPLVRTALGVAPDIRKGENVQVKVEAGATRLEVEGRAETSGAVGESVVVRNPTSGKVFRARVERAGLVSVDAGVKK